MNNKSVRRWQRRFAKVADLLADRLDDPPNLEEMATAASVSPFHFHRIWRALMGETVNQSVLRLRLEASKDFLTLPKSSVTETAAAVGFATPQSFARAFRRHTGTTPTEHRAARPATSVTPGKNFEVAIEERGEVLVVALRRVGKPYTELNATFASVWSWAEAVNVLSQLIGIYGIPLDDPESVPAENLRYDACLALGVDAAPEPMRVMTLPAGPYARFRHRGSYDGLESATQALTGPWLLASGWEPAHFPVFHHFINDPDNTAVEDLETDILLPLTSRAVKPT